MVLRRRGSAARAEAPTSVPSPRQHPGDGPTQAEADPRSERLAALASADGSGVQDLLREVAELRLALETDLVIAAAAVEADAADIAEGVVEGAIGSHRGASEALLDHLVADAHATRPRRRRRVVSQPALRRPLLLVTGVTAALGLVGGVAVGLQLSTSAASSTQAQTKTDVISSRADRSLDRLTQIAQDESGSDTQQWVGTVSDLHSDINSLISAAAGGDPAAAAAARDLLTRETALLNTVPGGMSAQAKIQVNIYLAQLQALEPTVLPSDVVTLLPAPPVLLSPSAAATRAPTAPASPTSAPTTSAPATPAAPSSAPSASTSSSSASPDPTGADGSSSPGGFGFPPVGNGRPAL